MSAAKRGAGTAPGKRPASKTARRSAPPKGRRKKKLSREDGLRAAAVASAFVCLSVVLTIVVLVLKKPASPGAAALPPVAEEPAPSSSPSLPPAVPPVLPLSGSASIQSEPDGNDSGAPSARPEEQGAELKTVPTDQPFPEAKPSPVKALPVTVPDSKLPAQGSGKVDRPHPVKKPEKTPQIPVSAKRPAVVSTAPSAPVEKYLKRGNGRRVAFVIDDCGNNLREIEPFLHLPFKLTMAVLPGLPHSAQAARRCREMGMEVILHQPMEPLGGQNPGPGTIRTGMTEAQIRAILERNLKEVGPVTGMNNHEGSRISKDRAIMAVVLAFCREHGIYYLDSKTTADSVAGAMAVKMGVHIRERDVFIDNNQERSSMIRSVQDGLVKAERKGAAVMIGHAWSSELASTLQQLYPELVEQGFSLSAISQVMMGKDFDEGLGD